MRPGFAPFIQFCWTGDKYKEFSPYNHVLREPGHNDFVTVKQRDKDLVDNPAELPRCLSRTQALEVLSNGSCGD